jgi:hypothetical protein
MMFPHPSRTGAASPSADCSRGYWLKDLVFRQTDTRFPRRR